MRGVPPVSGSLGHLLGSPGLRWPGWGPLGSMLDRWDAGSAGDSPVLGPPHMLRLAAKSRGMRVRPMEAWTELGWVGTWMAWDGLCWPVLAVPK